MNFTYMIINIPYRKLLIIKSFGTTHKPRVKIYLYKAEYKAKFNYRIV